MFRGSQIWVKFAILFFFYSTKTDIRLADDASAIFPELTGNFDKIVNVDICSTDWNKIIIIFKFENRSQVENQISNSNLTQTNCTMENIQKAWDEKKKIMEQKSLTSSIKCPSPTCKEETSILTCHCAFRCFQSRFIREQSREKKREEEKAQIWIQDR